MKVAVLADSLALPRSPEMGYVRYEDTYPVLLNIRLRALFRDQDILLIERGQRARTIGKVLDDWQEIVDWRLPQFVVVQVGVVDCAPRVFTPSQRSWIERAVPARIRNRILSLIKRYRQNIISQAAPKVYTPIADFAAGITEVIARARNAGVSRLFFVNILTPSADFERRSPGFTDNVRAYNAILVDRAVGSDVELIDFDELVAKHGGVDALSVDGMHPNAKGHLILANTLMDRIARAATY